MSSVLEQIEQQIAKLSTKAVKKNTGNIRTVADGVAKIDIHLAGVTLGGGAANDIAGRAVIVHAAPDDYTSQPAGNAGARVACGIITPSM